jgi:hypothetical protein
VKELIGEQLVVMVKTKRGFSPLEWRKSRERNEAPVVAPHGLGPAVCARPLTT